MSKSNLKIKFLSLLLVVALVITMVPMNVFAAESSSEEHTITFMSYDGSKVIGTITGKSTSSTNGSISGTSIKGYTLIGWKDVPTDTVDGDNENVMAAVKFDRDKTVYARYKITTYKLTIAYNNGTSSKTKYYNILSDPIIFPNDIEKENYTLKMWSGTGVEYDGENYYLPTGSTGNKIVNAIWEPDKYTIYFDSQGGSDVSSVECGYNCSLYDIPEPTKDGYRFQGWYSDKVGGTKLTTSTNMPAYDVTYYAHWTPINYKINLYSVEDDITYLKKQINYNVESEDIVLPEITREGYFFDGWTGEGIETPQKDILITKGSFGNKEYYANWTADPCVYEHDYENVITPATTNSEGKIIPTCKNCGKTKTAKTVLKIDKITLSTTSYTYDGNEKKPTVKVLDTDGNTLKSGTDYSVTYKNNKNVGAATATITFKGKYAGVVNKNYKINPKGTTIKSIYAESNKITVKWNKQSTQTSGYQIEYTWPAKVATSKIVTIKGSSVTSKAITKLTNNRDYYVRIRTFKDVDGTRYYSSWSSQKKVHIDKIQLSSKSVTLYRGQTKKLSLKYIPEGAKVTWKSSNKKVATVSSSGKVTAKGLGKTTISAKYKGVTYKATINVTYMKPSYGSILYDYDTRNNYFIVKIKNNSSKTMTILSGTTVVKDADYKSYDRKISLSKSHTIKPGKMKTIKFKVKGSTTWYDVTDFTLYYYFKFDGKKYYAKTNWADVSKYKSGSKWKNSYTDIHWFEDFRMEAWD